MPIWLDGPHFGRSLTAKAILAAGSLAVASGAAAFGLEPLTIGASRIVTKDTVSMLKGDLRGTAATTRAQPGLVSQDRSTLDLTQISMSEFGDADEQTR